MRLFMKGNAIVYCDSLIGSFIRACENPFKRDAINPSLGAWLQPSGLQDTRLNGFSQTLGSQLV